MGSRFWPVSTPDRPKQLLPLAGVRPLAVDTVERALTLVPPSRLRILTGEHLVDGLTRVLPDLPGETFLVEPRARGTAPVLAWAAWELARIDPQAVLVSLHSDHVIRPEAAFQALVADAVEVAREQERLVTVAVQPDRPETGYGYLCPGDPMPAPNGRRAHRVSAFVEKPDVETAGRYVEEGFLWNSGIFVWTAALFLEEVGRCAPEIAEPLTRLEDGDVEGFFEGVPTLSVDEAVLERSDRVGTVVADFHWDDVGSWNALSRTLEADGAGNVASGPAHILDGHDNIVFSDDGSPVVLFGVDGLVAVRTRGLTLVTTRERAPGLKALLERLPDDLRNPEV